MQIKESSKEYDVCIVGSGAGGGMTGKILAEAGASVKMLEAGPLFDAAQHTMFRWPYESPRRGAPTHRPFGEFDAAYGGWQIDGEPYTTTPGTSFDWFRSRMLGGRTNHWGRISLRFGPYDFKRRSMDGLGDDWPIGYDDIKPYYDKVDKLVGLFGSKEGIYNEPDGIFMEPPKPRLYEMLVKQACDRIGLPMIPARISIITEPLNGRAPCHYCSQCNRGCSTYSNFSSPSVLIRPAQQNTGMLEVTPNAMARAVTTNKDGKATGVSYVSKDDGLEYHVKAKIVVLAASACESIRLLLNSKSSRFPNGLANSSGLVGKYIMDSTGASASAIVPKLLDRYRYNEDGTGSMHMYIPWWGNEQKLDFPRGYHIEVWGGMDQPSYGFMGNIQAYNGKYGNKDGSVRPEGGGGYGKRLKEDYRRFYGSFVGMAGRGECVGREDNYCEIDPHTVDKYGIPVLRFNYTWSEHEYNQAKHMQQTFNHVFDEMGGERLGDTPGKDQEYGLLAPGRIIHELGGIRMGNDPKRSVLNKHCQAHDVDNLFVADGGPFVSQADKNPTWTILALAWRTADYIVDQRKKGNI